MKIRNHKRILSAFLVFLVVLTSFPFTFAKAASLTVAEWDFSANPTLLSNNTVVAATNGVNVEPGTTTVTLSTYMGKTINVTGSNGGTIYTSGWDNGANTKYWQAALNTSGFENLKLSFSAYGTGTGPRDFKLQYSVDHVNFTDIPNGAYTSPDAKPAVLTKSDLPLPAEMNDSPIVYLRFLQTSNLSIRAGTSSYPADEAVGSGGNARLFDVKITGDQKVDSSVVAAAEATPASGGTIAAGSLVHLTTLTADATIEYTLNGGPAQTINGASGDVFVDAFTQAGDTAVIRAKAVKGAAASVERTFVFSQSQVLPVTTNITGSVPANSQIQLSSPSAGAAIRYILTRKAGAPNETVDPEVLYNGPITLTQDMLPAKIEAYGTLAGYKDSAKSAFNYTLKDSAAVEKVYFGQLHGHTIQSDGSGTLEDAYKYARDVAKLDFFALTDHSNYFDTTAAPVDYDASKTNAKWQQGIAAAAAAATADFVPFYAYEMTWAGGPGHINTFATDGFVSRNNPKYASGVTAMKNYYDLLKTIPGSIGQFNHPGPTFGDFNGFSNYDPELNKHMTLIEVGNGEGAVGSGGYFRSYESYNNALDKGWHLAPTNNQDNHKGLWGMANTARTAIVTDNFTKEGVYDALRQLHVYATEDQNLQIHYTANDQLLGASFPSGIDELNINVDLLDPDFTDQIGKVSIVTNGGKESNVQVFSANSGEYSVKLSHPVNGYYYIKVVEVDGDIAVTAPVWVGDVEKVGINAVKASVNMPVAGEPLELSTEIFNNEASAVTIQSIHYKVGGATIADKTVNADLASLGTFKDTVPYTPTVVGMNTVDVAVHAVVNGVSRIFNQTILIKVRNPEKLVNIGVDASHLNEYVAGNYANSMTNFAKLAEDYDVRLVEIKGGITAEKLANLQGLILTPPNRKTSVGALGAYTTDEIAAVSDFAAHGKTLIVCGLADYGDGKNAEPFHAATQQNVILQAVQSKVRIVDDELIDNVNYVPSQNFRLRFKEYNTASPYNNGVDPGQEYSFYSGSSLLVPDSAKNSVTTIVASHATSESLDSDKDGKGGEGNPIAKGNIPVLTVETLASGAKLFVAGSVFMSNFEVQATLDNNLELGYSNYNISQNILKDLAPRTVMPIREVQGASEGAQFTIQGTVTSNASGYDQKTAFFDSIYVQDDTAGINLFPVSGNFKAGQKVEVTGTVGSYQNEKQLTVKTIAIIDNEVHEIAPAQVTTGAATSQANRGRLVKVEGTVKSIRLDSGKVGAITVNDGSGDVRVFIDGYITPDVNLEYLEAGDKISAIGLSSADTEGTRIRVRDRHEINWIKSGTMRKIGSYSTGFSDPAGGVAEIVKYNSDNNKFYLVNGKEKKVDIVSLNPLVSGQEKTLALEKRIDVSSMIKGFSFGDITSVDINTVRKFIAIAVQEEDYKKPGAVVLLDYNGNYISHYRTGVQPDMVTFTPDGNYLLTADEGEPRMGYASPEVDPQGSVTIVNLINGTTKIADFTAYDSSDARSGLLANNVILKKMTAPSVDLEPEYIAVSADSKKAYVTLQEANAIATLDITGGTFTSMKGLGFKDYSVAGNELDMRRDGTINIKTEPNVFGIYQPDGITAYTVSGKTYLITANEGDSRDWNGYLNEKDIKLGKGQDGDASKDIKLTTFDTSDYEVGVNGAGFASGKTYLFGARSFAIWDAENMSLVYDSGSTLEKKTAKYLPNYFNWSNDDLVFEKRSAKKGPEPEDVKVGVVDGKPYVFVGLERIGGNMMFDLSDVHAPAFTDYLNTRDFAGSIDSTGSKPVYKIAGDVSPEGQAFVPADKSPTRYPLLLVANEVSGTVSVVEIPEGYYTPSQPETPSNNTGSSGTNASTQPGGTTVTGTTAVVEVELNAQTGEAVATLSDEAAGKLLEQAKENEKSGKDVVVEIRSVATSDTKKLTSELSSDFLKKLASGTNASLQLNTGFATITLSHKAVENITQAAKGSSVLISVDKVPSSDLNGSAQAAVGNRPVFDFTIESGNNKIIEFGGEAVRVSIPYSLGAGENPNAIVIYYLDTNGNPVPVTSRYNEVTKAVEFITNHFSRYAVAYTPIHFNDITGHWAANAIQYASARGLFAGVGEGIFGPEQTLTRGMLVTVLGKMAGANPTEKASFSDVAADQYYASYIAWAASHGIAQGVGGNRFAPDQAVTREELAVLLSHFASYMKMKTADSGMLPAFTDENQTSSWAKTAVTQIHSLGWISGKPGNLYDPKGTATRAEVSAILQKVIESNFAE
ncbi:choice-of-anchor I family protein [Gorillibacterium massiliense]|uniref:choice-of-anchor I family protein n=1 Tax=Gorillibacterium massiliense TaxID=1280390 RepID=UPI0004B2DD61|nr:choice-of-anchor I family protein [Gorillibacterium massiliense]